MPVSAHLVTTILVDDDAAQHPPQHRQVSAGSALLMAELALSPPSTERFLWAGLSNGLALRSNVRSAELTFVQPGAPDTLAVRHFRQKTASLLFLQFHKLLCAPQQLSLSSSTETEEHNGEAYGQRTPAPRETPRAQGHQGSCPPRNAKGTLAVVEGRL